MASRQLPGWMSAQRYKQTGSRLPRRESRRLRCVCACVRVAAAALPDERGATGEECRASPFRWIPTHLPWLIHSHLYLAYISPRRAGGCPRCRSLPTPLSPCITLPRRLRHLHHVEVASLPSKCTTARPPMPCPLLSPCDICVRDPPVTAKRAAMSITRIYFAVSSVRSIHTY